MTANERATWETIVERAKSERNRLVPSVAHMERYLSGESRILNEERRLLAEYDAVLAVDAELTRLRGQEG